MDTPTIDGALTAHDAAAPVELEDILTATMERLVEKGTACEARALEAMSAATRTLCPGAAAALVDWHGTEVARLRAFGIVHGVALGMPEPHRRHLLHQLLHPSSAAVRTGHAPPGALAAVR
jgi:hypothetical protein